MTNRLTEIFTTLVNECKEDEGIFRVVHIKKVEEESKIIVNEKSSVESLVDRMMKEISPESSLEIKRFGTTQVVFKII